MMAVEVETLASLRAIGLGGREFSPFSFRAPIARDAGFRGFHVSVRGVHGWLCGILLRHVRVDVLHVAYRL